VGITLLLDTHALVWWWTDDKRLPLAPRHAIADPDNTVVVSAVSAREMATRYRVGKWPEVAAVLDAFETNLLKSRFHALPVTVAHARLAGTLQGSHRDPFDRMLIAQARAEAMPIVSRDAVFRDYGVSVIWSGAEPATPLRRRMMLVPLDLA
jgi:PIN domain nuclease of toxin-antitoxin system